MAIWCILGPSCAILVCLGPSWGYLEPSYGHLGSILGSFWVIWGPSWGLSSPFRGHLGSILGPSWGHLGASLGHLVAILWPLVALCGIWGGGHLGAILWLSITQRAYCHWLCTLTNRWPTRPSPAECARHLNLCINKYGIQVCILNRTLHK